MGMPAFFTDDQEEEIIVAMFESCLFGGGELRESTCVISGN